VLETIFLNIELRYRPGDRTRGHKQMIGSVEGKKKLYSRLQEEEHAVSVEGQRAAAKMNIRYKD
jgi:hypothetical protein